MSVIKILLKYRNSIVRADIPPFEIDCISEDSQISDFYSTIRKKLLPLLQSDFCEDKLLSMGENHYTVISSNTTLLTLSKDGIINILYSEVVVPIGEGHIDQCNSANGGSVIFDIYPREYNHRFLPHVAAKCGNETIRIIISDEPRILGIAHFTGNNYKNEKIALAYVKQRKDTLMDEWNRIVKCQFSNIS